ncbi:MAG TPA: hypothetical protein VN081_06145 [Dongiaceae bacterium]|nr:hypothetical protein [Dongiaceae bacterium]
MSLFDSRRAVTDEDSPNTKPTRIVPVGTYFTEPIPIVTEITPAGDEPDSR